MKNSHGPNQVSMVFVTLLVFVFDKKYHFTMCCMGRNIIMMQNPFVQQNICLFWQMQCSTHFKT